MTLDKAALVQNVDETAGDWPLDLAEEFAGLALRCLSIDCEPNTDLNISRVMENLNKIKYRADALMARGGPQVVSNDDDTDDVPRVFICPIFQVRLLTHFLNQFQHVVHIDLRTWDNVWA